PPSELSTRSLHDALPILVRMKEVAVGGTQVPGRRRARSAAQHVLPAHEFAVVLADCAVRDPEARVRCIRARGPLPDVAVELSQRRLRIVRSGARSIAARRSE